MRVSFKNLEILEAMMPHVHKKLYPNASEIELHDLSASIDKGEKFIEISFGVRVKNKEDTK